MDSVTPTEAVIPATNATTESASQLSQVVMLECVPNDMDVDDVKKLLDHHGDM